MMEVRLFRDIFPDTEYRGVTAVNLLVSSAEEVSPYYFADDTDSAQRPTTLLRGGIIGAVFL